jgi:putative acetyltransferase
MSAVGLRPYLSADAAVCAQMFRDSVDLLTEDDYDEEQRAAWARSAGNEKAFAQKLAEGLTLVALVDGAHAGFATLKGDVIEFLYVSPSFARRGVGAALLDALTKLARARGVVKLKADVSETARPLFTKSGFVGERRNLVSIGDTWLPNTAMSTALTPTDHPPPTRH